MEPTRPEEIVESPSPRRAIPSFDPNRPIPDALLGQILQRATLASSAYNLQPWRFLVVRSAANRRKLREAMLNLPAMTEAPVVVIVLGYLNPERSHLAAIVDTMQALGALGPDDAAEWRARASRSMARIDDRVLWATRWSMLAASHLTLAADSLGVSSAVFESIHPDRLLDAFGIPDDHTPCCLIALGFSPSPPPDLGRLPLSEICFSEHFGQPSGLDDGP